MSKAPTAPPASRPVEIDLKDPMLAAFLAWLIPGVGHLYQGRTAKGILFLVCILGTFCDGVYMSDSHAVYASMRPGDRRLPYLAQFWAGLGALPAIVQAFRVSRDQAPLWNGFMAPPRLPDQNQQFDELAQWNKQLHRYFELGTVYTMIAGLLNILAIYDAWAGPVQLEADEEDDEEQQKKSRSERK